MKFCWTTITVQDMKRSLDFYQKVLGLRLIQTMQPNPSMEISFLGEGDTQVELIWSADHKAPAFGPDISLGFEVDSLEQVTAFLETKGISLHSGPVQPNPFIRFAYILDPDGLKIQLVENIRH